MASTTSIINTLLNPYLSQIIGSTPSGIKDNLVKANVKGNYTVGTQLTAVSVYASCVNKATLEQMIIKPEFAEIRPYIAAAFSISGKANMTAITLFGHCLLTTGFLDDVTFVSEFRRKLGQHDLWAGSLDAGSLSDVQRKIMKEKVRVHSAVDAKLFGSGYFKFVGLNPAAMTADEARFWGVSIATTAPPRRARPIPVPVPPAAAQSKPPPKPPSEAEEESGEEMLLVTLKSGKEEKISRKAYDYYMSVRDDDYEALLASVERTGGADFTKNYGKLADVDPEKKGKIGGSVIG